VRESNPVPRELLETIRSRALDDGGFSMLPGGEYRPDATAWAVLALAAARVDGRDAVFVESSRSRLAAGQQKDGRVSISPSHPESFWPTAIAVLAWVGSPGHAEAQSRAVNFLLSTSGKHWVKVPDSPLAHDTSLRGWPWTEETHSWVEPTSMALLALKATGHGNHERVTEGVRMLLDRQLPSGGWNYGNTFAYGRELHPQPDVTGAALTALVGLVPEKQLKRSLEYLKEWVSRLHTPRSLGWAVLGLGAWRSRPRNSDGWIMDCVKRQERYGIYDTTLLSLLFLAWMAERGFAFPHPADKGKP
jgi:hypothetical protein